MTDTEQILIKMAEGFGEVHKRLNAMTDQTTARQLLCGTRFAGIEQQMAVKNAISDVKEVAKGKKVALQSVLVNSALGTIIIGVLVVLWKIFIGHIDLIVR